MAQVESNGRYGNYKLLKVQDSEDSDIEFQQPVKKTPTVVWEEMCSILELDKLCLFTNTAIAIFFITNWLL